MIVHSIHQIVQAYGVIDDHLRKILMQRNRLIHNAVEIAVHGIRLRQHKKSLPEVNS